MKKKILGFLAAGLMMVGVTGMGVSAGAIGVGEAGRQVVGVMGASCKEQWMGFKTWYNGLCNSNGEIKTPKQTEGEHQIATFVWTIVLNIIFDVTLAVGYLALAMVVYGGYMYIMSDGDPSKAAKGQKTLTAAVIGAVIAMSATVIVNTIGAVLSISVNSGDIPKGFKKSTIQGAFNWAYAMAGAIAVIFIVKGGINYMTSSGDPSKASRATKGIIFAVVGLVIVVAAAAITSFILSSIGEAV